MRGIGWGFGQQCTAAGSLRWAERDRIAYWLCDGLPDGDRNMVTQNRKTDLTASSEHSRFICCSMCLWAVLWVVVGVYKESSTNYDTSITGVEKM